MQQLRQHALRALIFSGALLFAGAALAEDSESGNSALAKQAQCLQDAFANYTLAKAQCDTQSANGGQQAYCLTVAAQNFAQARDACYTQTASHGPFGDIGTNVDHLPKKKPSGGSNHISIPKPNFGQVPVAHVTSQSNNPNLGGPILR